MSAVGINADILHLQTPRISFKDTAKLNKETGTKVKVAHTRLPSVGFRS